VVVLKAPRAVTTKTLTVILVAVAFAGCGRQETADQPLPPAQPVTSGTADAPATTATGPNDPSSAPPISTTTSHAPASAPKVKPKQPLDVLSPADRTSFARLQARLGGRWVETSAPLRRERLRRSPNANAQSTFGPVEPGHRRRSDDAPGRDRARGLGAVSDAILRVWSQTTGAALGKQAPPAPQQ
jgi:hypothetical protein